MADCSGLLTQAVGLVQQAVDLDNKQRYEQAFELYTLALEAFHGVLKRETNPTIQRTIRQKISSYLDRAEEIKKYLDSHADTTTQALPGTPSGDPSTAPTTAPTTPAASRGPPARPATTSAVVATPTVTVKDGQTQIIRIADGETGVSYESHIAPLLVDGTTLVLEEPYLTAPHQMCNLLRFAEMVVRLKTYKHIHVVTKSVTPSLLSGGGKPFDVIGALKELQTSLLRHRTIMKVYTVASLHDREIRSSNGATVKIGRGLDIYHAPSGRFCIGNSDLSLRPCRSTTIELMRSHSPGDMKHVAVLPLWTVVL
eukprot:TRINITY_DN4798_c0_g1_i1.p1 TRINITY_DN4798_c0_g1~~TRINITY_DN4798_c0_g1_i1.p1  ORF type:complete len:312 (-),score=29.68 TRINITY_DN4798_c0_g1_i1:283-1218(-)